MMGFVFFAIGIGCYFIGRRIEENAQDREKNELNDCSHHSCDRYDDDFDERAWLEMDSRIDFYDEK